MALTPFQITAICLLGLQLAFALLTLLWLLLPLRHMRRLPVFTAVSQSSMAPQEVAENDSEENIPEPTGARPKVSVVIYSTVDEDRLTRCLEELSVQDYPDFEVIVVCDATSETSGMLAEKYAAMFSNVYVTFIPPGSHNLSRRKLALTLGMKAATGDVVITTVANASFASSGWISLMTAPFIANPATELALGYSRFDFREIHGPGKWYKEFITLLTDSRWIGYALRGRPYRGDGFNLAFRRNLFFRSKGYAKSIHLHSGDDDLFVSEIASGENTSLVITPAAFITTDWGASASRVWNLRKSQYDFTSRWLPRGPFFRAGAVSLCQWLVLLCGVAAAFFALWPECLPVGIAGAAIAATIWIAFLLFEIGIYRRAAGRLHASRLAISVPLFWLWKPIGNAFFRYSHRNTKFKNYTWQRQKNPH